MKKEVENHWYMVSMVPSNESIFPSMRNGDPEEFYQFIAECGACFVTKWPSSLPDSSLFRIRAANDEAYDKKIIAEEVVDAAMTATSADVIDSDSELTTLYVLIEKFAVKSTKENGLTDEEDPICLWAPDALETEPVREPFLKRVLRAVGF